MRLQTFSTKWVSILGSVLALMSIAACGSGDSPAPQSPAPPLTNDRPPTASAGLDRFVISGSVVTLDGSGNDPDGENLTYQWTQLNGTRVKLSDSATARPRLIAPYTGKYSYVFELMVSDEGGHSAFDTVYVEVNPGFIGCNVTAPPPSLGAPAEFTKYCDSNGIPVLAYDVVSDRAIEWAAHQLRQITSKRPDYLDEIIRQGTRWVVIGQNQDIKDLSVFSHLTQLPDGKIVRGLGPVIGQPYGASSEENLLCLDSDADRFRGESVTAHEGIHMIHNMAIRQIDPSLNDALVSDFDSVSAAGRLANLHAGISVDEYVAEMGQSYLAVNWESSEHPEHNDVDTPDELRNFHQDTYQHIEQFVQSGMNFRLCSDN